MSGFSVSWLDLRESADHRARDAGLLKAAADHLEDVPNPLIVDLGCGTGSTFRAITPALSRPVRWRFVDHDPALLAEVRRRAGSDAEVETVEMDLSAIKPLPFSGAAMVTASALFDLASANWLARLVATAASHGAAVYGALSYDGKTTWSDPHPLDGPVLAAFNRDQRKVKSFGPALGPDGAIRLAEALERAGYHVRTAESPWRLGPEDRALVEELARGIAQAVTAELDADTVDDWLAHRLAAAETGTVEIGHIDVLGLPA